jgi:hypothetical protein
MAIEIDQDTLLIIRLVIAVLRVLRLAGLRSLSSISTIGSSDRAGFTCAAGPNTHHTTTCPGLLGLMHPMIQIEIVVHTILGVRYACCAPSASSSLTIHVTPSPTMVCVRYSCNHSGLFYFGHDGIDKRPRRPLPEGDTSGARASHLGPLTTTSSPRRAERAAAGS